MAIKKLTIKVKKSEKGGIFHDSRHDIHVLAKTCNALIEKVNELTDKVNELTEQQDIKQLYQEERNKLGNLPDADADFIALDNAYKRLERSRK